MTLQRMPLMTCQRLLRRYMLLYTTSRRHAFALLIFACLRLLPPCHAAAITRAPRQRYAAASAIDDAMLLCRR